MLIFQVFHTQILIYMYNFLRFVQVVNLEVELATHFSMRKKNSFYLQTIICLFTK